VIAEHNRLSERAQAALAPAVAAASELATDRSSPKPLEEQRNNLSRNVTGVMRSPKGIKAAVQQSCCRVERTKPFMESAMKRNARHQLSKGFRRTAIAIAVSGILTAPAVHASIASNIVVVPPTKLPELARQTGEALMLHNTNDGRTFLYIEQDQGARLAIFDVSDPVDIKGEGSVQLGAAGPFDFVSSLGSEQELLKYRRGDEEAVLDIHKVRDPSLQPLQGLTLGGSVTRLGNDGFIDATASAAQPAGDYQIVETASARGLKRVFDVKHVRGEVSKSDTGTTFLLADDGLYVVRQPEVESDKKLREQQWLDNHGAE
jgi:hypothetical protein